MNTSTEAIRSNRSGHNDRKWTLADEKIFLDHLGTRFWSRNTRLERPELLKLYSKTIWLRSEPWVKYAYAYCEKLLKEETR